MARSEMTRSDRARSRLEAPKGLRTPMIRLGSGDGDAFGRFTESFARAMGTPWFLVGMTIFCVIWIAYNSWAPTAWQFDPRALNFTLLTLILSLQASYAAPMILLAQNRQDDRDRVQIEQDRQRAERNLADTEYLAREIVALRLALKDVATREVVRSELRSLLEELAVERGADPDRPREHKQGRKRERERDSGRESGRRDSER